MNQTDSEQNDRGAQEEAAELNTAEELREYLLSIRDRMREPGAPVYALAAMRRVMNLPTIYELLDKENKEIGRDIWLRLKQAGFHLKNPPLLFDAEEGEQA
jgi:hypothetical protein